MSNKYLAGLLVITFIVAFTACKNESAKNAQENKIVSQTVKSEIDISKNSNGSQNISSRQENEQPVNSEEAKVELLKQEVKKVHLQNIQYLIEGNAKKLIKVFSIDGYTEFSDVFKKEKPKLDKGYFERLFAGDLYPRYKNKKLEEVLILNRINIKIYKKTGGEINNSNFNKHMAFIEFIDGDANIQYLPQNDCPIIMWDAFYRKVNGEWMLIGGNFWTGNYMDSLYKVK